MGQGPRLCNLSSKYYSEINIPYTSGDDLVRNRGRPFKRMDNKLYRPKTKINRVDTERRCGPPSWSDWSVPVVGSSVGWEARSVPVVGFPVKSYTYPLVYLCIHLRREP